MCVCRYVCIYIHVCRYTYICIHTYLHTYIHIGVLYSVEFVLYRMCTLKLGCALLKTPTSCSETLTRPSHTWGSWLMTRFTFSGLSTSSSAKNSVAARSIDMSRSRGVRGSRGISRSRGIRGSRGVGCEFAALGVWAGSAQSRIRHTTKMIKGQRPSIFTI